jgi:hypothetical protein
MELIQTRKPETIFKIPKQLNGPVILANKSFKINCKGPSLYPYAHFVGFLVGVLGTYFLSCGS